MNAMNSAPKPRQSAVARYARPVHRKAATMIGYALIQDAPLAWSELADYLRNRLSIHDLASLAFAVLRALPARERDEVVEAAFHDRAGPPLPPFFDLASEAEGWAALSGDDERQAYLGAIWRELSPREKADFRRFCAEGGRDA